MDLTIDGQDTYLDVEAINTLDNLVKHIENEYVQPPRVITRILLNGEELDEAQQIGLGGFSIDDIATIDIETADTLELAHEAMDDAQVYLPEISSVLEDAAVRIREGNIQDGLTLASEALNIIEMFGEVLEGLRTTYMIDFSKVKVEDFNLLDKLNLLGQHARSILKAAQEENWTHFADLLQYELSPLLYEWMAVIPSLVELLPKPRNGNGHAGDNGLDD